MNPSCCTCVVTNTFPRFAAYVHVCAEHLLLHMCCNEPPGPLAGNIPRFCSPILGTNPSSNVPTLEYCSCGSDDIFNVARRAYLTNPLPRSPVPKLLLWPGQATSEVLAQKYIYPRNQGATMGRCLGSKAHYATPSGLYIKLSTDGLGRHYSRN